jgi:hypothetical protein
MKLKLSSQLLPTTEVTMVSTSIFCSDIFSGDGRFVGSSTLSSYNKLLDFLKNTWLKCNVTSETHECKAIVTVDNAPEGFPNEFCLGMFVFHYNKRKATHEIFISHTIDEEYIEAFEKVGMSGGFQDHLSEDDLFRARFEYLQNLNNPHRLLGTWIQKLDDDFDLYDLLESEKKISEASDEMVENSLLSTILKFAKIHQKGIETLYWLGSNDGQKFLNYFDTYSVASKLGKAANSLLEELNASNNSDFLIDEFITRFENSSIPEPVLF